MIRDNLLFLGVPIRKTGVFLKVFIFFIIFYFFSRQCGINKIPYGRDEHQAKTKLPRALKKCRKYRQSLGWKQSLFGQANAHGFYSFGREFI